MFAQNRRGVAAGLIFEYMSLSHSHEKRTANTVNETRQSKSNVCSSNFHN